MKGVLAHVRTSHGGVDRSMLLSHGRRDADELRYGRTKCIQEKAWGPFSYIAGYLVRTKTGSDCGLLYHALRHELGLLIEMA